MTLARSVADVLNDHVTLEVECIDRMYLNLYVPKLQYEMGVVGFFRGHLGYAFASSALMDPITTVPALPRSASSLRRRTAKHPGRCRSSSGRAKSRAPGLRSRRAR
jgi:hypothetical protein